jgi:uncharacterized membrane protein required for colicin V production
MNALDGIILFLFVAGLMVGYMRGMIRQAIGLAGFFAAYLIAFKFYDDVSPWVGQWFPTTEMASESSLRFLSETFSIHQFIYNATAFGLLFFGTKLGLFIVGRLLDMVAALPGLSLLNRWGGVLLGALEVVLVVGIAVNIIAVLPWETGNRWVMNSMIGSYMVDEAPIIAHKLRELWSQASS